MGCIVVQRLQPWEGMSAEWFSLLCSGPIYKRALRKLIARSSLLFFGMSRLGSFFVWKTYPVSNFFPGASKLYVCLGKIIFQIRVQFGLGHMRVLVLFLLSLKGKGAQQSKSPVKADKELKSASLIRQKGRKRKAKWSIPQESSVPPGTKCCWFRLRLRLGKDRNKEDGIKWVKEDWACGAEQGLGWWSSYSWIWNWFTRGIQRARLCVCVCACVYIHTYKCSDILFVI